MVHPRPLMLLETVQVAYAIAGGAARQPFLSGLSQRVSHMPANSGRAFANLWLLIGPQSYDHFMLFASDKHLLDDVRENLLLLMTLLTPSHRVV